MSLAFPLVRSVSDDPSDARLAGLGLAAIAIFLFALAAFSPQALGDGDTWSHVATGEWILGTNDMPSHISAILKLQLCIGARVGELCGMTAEELERDGASALLLWNLPAARSKNGSSRTTPIAGLALEIIEPRLNDGRLFSSLSGTTPRANIVGSAIIARRDRMPIAPFTSHDLRRTVATEMAKLGLPLEVVAAVLGQESGGAETRVLRKHYVHSPFVDRKTTALGGWDRRLREILAGEVGKVIPLRAGLVY
jgi:integrase